MLREVGGGGGESGWGGGGVSRKKPGKGREDAQEERLGGRGFWEYWYFLIVMRIWVGSGRLTGVSVWVFLCVGVYMQPK